MTHPEELYNYDILLFKLTSGDTIVSYADISDPDTVRLFRPLELRFMSGRRQKGHGLMPWFPFSDDEVYNVNRNHIVIIVKPIKIMIEGYINSQEMYDEEPVKYRYTEEENVEDYDMASDDSYIDQYPRVANEESAKILDAMLEKTSNTFMKVH